jgi:hypothetical protein
MIGLIGLTYLLLLNTFIFIDSISQTNSIALNAFKYTIISSVLPKIILIRYIKINNIQLVLYIIYVFLINYYSVEHILSYLQNKNKTVQYINCFSIACINIYVDNLYLISIHIYSYMYDRLKKKNEEVQPKLPEESIVPQESIVPEESIVPQEVPKEPIVPEEPIVPDEEDVVVIRIDELVGIKKINTQYE